MRRRRVAILGGGPAGLACAFELARLRDVELTIYEARGVLGGKCASVRDPNQGFRNQEHGIHVLLGFYENTFHLLREAHAEIGGPWPRWEDGFIRHNSLALDDGDDGRWDLHFSPGPGTPGDRARDCALGERGPGTSVEELYMEIQAWLRRRANTWISSPLARLAGILSDIDQNKRGDIRRAFAATPVKLRRGSILLELAAATLHGLARLRRRGAELRSINDRTLVAWLEENAPLGALTAQTRASSALRMAHEIVFAFAGGDTAQPNLAAGVGVGGLIRLLINPQGAITYHMRAGMGETVISPLYDAILTRAPATRVLLHHRVSALLPDRSRNSVAAVNLEVRGSAAQHRVERRQFGELQVWVEAPVSGPAQQLRLERGRDFDDLVLAIPGPALAPVTQALCQRSPGLRNALAATRSIRTVAAQLWLARSAAACGLGSGPRGEPVLAGGYPPPWTNLGDYAHVIAAESWQPPAPQGLLMLCGPVVESGAAVEVLFDQWWRAHGRRILPAAPSDSDALAQWCRSLYLRDNAAPTDRFVSAEAGTIDQRLAPDASGFDNLYLAGDWTHTGLNASSVEAAVISAMVVKRAIAGENHAIYGYEAPTGWR